MGLRGRSTRCRAMHLYTLYYLSSVFSAFVIQVDLTPQDPVRVRLYLSETGSGGVFWPWSVEIVDHAFFVTPTITTVEMRSRGVLAIRRMYPEMAKIGTN